MTETPVRVLLVDDDAMIRTMLAEALQLHGHHVTTAGDGPEALDLFEPGRYDVVVTDLRMPAMSGWELVERIHQADPGVPLIIISGVATAKDDKCAQETGVALLHKPISLDLLRGTIEALSRR